ncbi:MAG: hypothetical protein WCE38_04710, partial [Burkholderiales bacterium]
MKRALPRMIAAWVLACCSAFVSIGFTGPVAAQTAPDAERTSIEAMKGRLSDALARQDVEPTLKAQIVEAYKNAITALESASSLRTEAAEMRKAADGAEESIQQLERELRSVRAEAAAPERLAKVDALPLDALER